jgi:hypothetical protein
MLVHNELGLFVRSKLIKYVDYGLFILSSILNNAFATIVLATKIAGSLGTLLSGQSFKKAKVSLLFFE